MVKLLALLLLPVFGWAANPTTVQCWDGYAWTIASDATCPPNATQQSGAAVTDTTALISVNLTREVDALYHRVRALSSGVCPTLSTIEQMIDNGVEIEDAPAGFNEFPVTGLTAEAGYCVEFLAVQDGYPAEDALASIYVKQSTPWFQLESDEEPPPDGDDIEAMNSLFVGAGGNDSNDCETHADRCLTLDGIESKGQSTSMRVYGLTGSVDTTSTTFTINWSGTSEAWAGFDTYYIDAGNDDQPTAYEEGSGSGRGERFIWRPSARMNVSFSAADRDYVEFRNIIVDGTFPPTGEATDAQHPARISKWMVINGSGNYRVFNSSFSHARGYNCFELENLTTFSIVRSELYMCGNLYRRGPDDVVSTGGDSIHFDGSGILHIENSKFVACGHNCLHDGGNYSVVRRNSFRNEWDSVYGTNAGYRSVAAFTTTSNSEPKGLKVYELNDLSRIGIPPPASGEAPWMKAHGQNSIYRYNSFSNDGRITAGFAINVVNCCSGDVVDFNRIYNNHMVDQEDAVVDFRNNSRPYAVHGNELKNNRFGIRRGTSNIAVRFRLLADRRTVPSDAYDANALRGNCFEQATVQVQNVELGTTVALSSLESSRPDIFSGNLTNNACTAEDAGLDLTTTVGGGTGTVVTVADSNYFTDGNGIITGDVIDIGGSVRTITAINKATHQITVIPSLTWTNGQPVNLACNAAVKHGLKAECGTPGTDW